MPSASSSAQYSPLPEIGAGISSPPRSSMSATPPPRHETYAGDQLTARETAVRVAVHAGAGHRQQLEKRRSAVEQQAQTLARQQLAGLTCTLAVLALGRDRAGLALLHARHERLHP